MRKIDQLNQLQSEMMEARTHVEDLCRDWGWTLADKATNDELVEELQMQLDMAKEELAYYHDVEKDYNNDIKLFQEENAKLIDENIELEGQIAFKDGQIIGLNQRIKELEDKVEELTNAKLDSIVKKHVEGDDAMEQPKTEPKKKLSILDQIKKAEQQKKDNAEKDIVKEALETKEEVVETNEYAINFKQVVRDEKVNDFSATMSEICGEITIDKTYNFKASNNYYYPIVYGCFNEEVIEQARQIIKDKVDRFNLYPERTNAVSFKYAQDKEYPIVVWRMIDKQGNKIYNAYTKLKSNHISVLSLDEKKLSNIIKTSVNSLFSDKPAWRKLDNEQLADKFRAVCADIWPEDFAKEQHEETNEIVVDFTNDPTAGCDDLDI